MGDLRERGPERDRYSPDQGRLMLHLMKQDPDSAARRRRSWTEPGKTVII
jgi:hypothetical protein